MQDGVLGLITATGWLNYGMLLVPRNRRVTECVSLTQCCSNNARTTKALLLFVRWQEVKKKRFSQQSIWEAPAISWDKKPCSLILFYRRFGSTPSIFWLEVQAIKGASGDRRVVFFQHVSRLYQTTRRHISSLFADETHGDISSMKRISVQRTGIVTIRLGSA